MLLLELVLAMVFISVALVGLLDGFRSSMEAQWVNGARTELRLLLDEKMNDLERENFFQAGAAEGEFTDKPSYSWKTEIQPAKASSLYRVKVIVTGHGERMEAAAYLLSRGDPE
jgi:type II secretory pathway component PulJ